MSVIRGMNQGSKKTPMIVAVCSTIIACALGIALLTKSNDDYMTEDQVMELLASNYADNMTEDQIKTILKTVTSKVETDYSDLDLSSLLTKDNAAWLKTYISREVAEATKNDNISPEKIKEITDMVVKQLDENQRKSLDEMSGKNDIMTSEINSVKQEIEEFRRVKAQLEEILKDTKDDSKVSVSKEAEARKRAIEQTEASIRTLKELIEKNKSSQSTDLANKVKDLENLIAKYRDSSNSENKSGLANLLSQINDINNSLKDEIKKKNEDLERKNKELEELIAKNQAKTDETIQKNKDLYNDQIQQTINNFNKNIENFNTNINNKIDEGLEPYQRGMAQTFDSGKTYTKHDIFIYTGEDDKSGKYGFVKTALVDANNVIKGYSDTTNANNPGYLQKNHLYQVLSNTSNGTSTAGVFIDITACDKISQIEKKNVSFKTQDNGDGTYLLLVTGDIPNFDQQSNP